MEIQKTQLLVTYEATPNPSSMKFNLSTVVAEESVFFDDPQKALRSPLAQKLFGFAWVQAVMVGPTFVTVTKQNWVEWSQLADPLSDLIAEHLERNEGVLLAAPAPVAGNETDSAIVTQIKEILDTQIRPAVALDGGDIIFDRYENNKLYLHMVGACAGCPSSTMTLKHGIETRIREALPEVEEVISI